MANQEHIERLIQGVKAWNQWSIMHPDVLPDFSNADLHGADLSGADLRGADLHGADLSGADLSGAILSRADLSGANLIEAELGRTILIEANLHGANLSGAHMSEANLSGVNLSAANLSNAVLWRAYIDRSNLRVADLRGADLRGADLSGADLNAAKLEGANLLEAKLIEATLRGAELDRANLREADLSGTKMLEYEREQLRDRGVVGLDRVIIITEPSKEEPLTVEIPQTLRGSPKLKVAESTSTLGIRIAQQPLTARNLATITLALTQLHTQCWLIATGRFTDLIEYAQTHNPHYDEEANLTIAQMTHHSPAEITFNVSLEGVANALRTSIDAVLGMWARKRELELKNTALEEEIQRKKQETENTLTDEKIAQQVALVTLYDKQIELRRKQLDLLDYAAEKAPKIVEALHPDADTTTKAMAANTLIKALLQLGEAEGLERLLPPPDSKPPLQTS